MGKNKLFRTILILLPLTANAVSDRSATRPLQQMWDEAKSTYQVQLTEYYKAQDQVNILNFDMLQLDAQRKKFEETIAINAKLNPKNLSEDQVNEQLKADPENADLKKAKHAIQTDKDLQKKKNAIVQQWMKDHDQLEGTAGEPGLNAALAALKSETDLNAELKTKHDQILSDLDNVDKVHTKDSSDVAGNSKKLRKSLNDTSATTNDVAKMRVQANKDAMSYVKETVKDNGATKEYYKLHPNRPPEVAKAKVPPPPQTLDEQSLYCTTKGGTPDDKNKFCDFGNGSSTSYQTLKDIHEGKSDAAIDAFKARNATACDETKVEEACTNTAGAKFIRVPGGGNPDLCQFADQSSMGALAFCRGPQHANNSALSKDVFGYIPPPPPPPPVAAKPSDCNSLATDEVKKFMITHQDALARQFHITALKTALFLSTNSLAKTSIENGLKKMKANQKLNLDDQAAIDKMNKLYTQYGMKEDLAGAKQFVADLDSKVYSANKLTNENLSQFYLIESTDPTSGFGIEDASTAYFFKDIHQAAVDAAKAAVAAKTQTTLNSAETNKLSLSVQINKYLGNKIANNGSDIADVTDPDDLKKLIDTEKANQSAALQAALKGSTSFQTACSNFELDLSKTTCTLNQVYPSAMAQALNEMKSGAQQKDYDALKTYTGAVSEYFVHKDAASVEDAAAAGGRQPASATNRNRRH